MARAVEQGGPMPTGMTRHEAVNQGLASLQAKPKPSCWAAALGAISRSRTGRSPGEIFESISNTITPSIGDISIRIIDHDKGSSQFTPGIVSVTFWVS